MAHNVDHHEIAKFEAVASRWWDLEGEFKPLHRINPRVLAILRSVLAACLAKGTRCWLRRRHPAESMAREGATVTGLDMGFEPLQVAKLHALESGVQVEYVRRR